MPAFTTRDHPGRDAGVLDLPSKMPAFTTLRAFVERQGMLDLPSKMPAFTTANHQCADTDIFDTNSRVTKCPQAKGFQQPLRSKPNPI